MKLFKKAILTSVLFSLASISLQPISATAVDRCIPDTISTDRFSIHPGQSMGLKVNGSMIGEECTTPDPGFVVLDYTDRNSGISETLTMTDANSWKWKNFTYEELVKLMAVVGIKANIDAQKLLSIFFFRIKDGKVDTQNATATLPIVLDPTPAGPCHPDLVAFKTDLVSLTSSVVQTLDGVETAIQCTIIDPGWIAFGYVLPGSTTIELSQLYFDQWTWGGEIDYAWVTTMLGYGNIDTSKIVKGSKFELRFFRGGSPKTPLADLGAFTLVTSFTIDLPTAEQITAQKVAIEKAAADAKAAADKAASDKLAADKAAADKLAAEKAATTKAAASKKTTITCVKGKISKKVTAVKPKCPAGYKKK